VSDEAELARHAQTDCGAGDLLEQALARENLARAWKRVKANKGSAGVDRRTVQDTGEYLKDAWPEIRQRLLDGTYKPEPVRRVGIPKPGGGTRELGIPTVTDRLIQQALLQVLQPLIDPTFSEHGYGFRPGRSAHQAVLAAQAHVEAGHRVVVDVDLEKFFDRVNHDILMDRLAKRIADKRVLRLIRRYLQAGILSNGVCIDRHEGTPQGGPLSPLLANVLLDEVDRELERRGQLTRRVRGRSMEQVAQDLQDYVPGWKAYFHLAQTPRVMRELDEWLRHRLRALQLKQWKRGTRHVPRTPSPGRERRCCKTRCGQQLPVVAQ
jgi:retron-type reverse transcriptase